MAETDDIEFGIVDEKTVDRLQKDGDIELPKRKVDVPKDKRWNTKQIHGRLMNGILNGDSVEDIAKSLEEVTETNQASTNRIARTLVTGSCNRGRLDSYEELEEQGVVIKKVWLAVPDDRARQSHLELDGEERDPNKKFSNGLMFPGDPKGKPAEVWNCRCSLISNIVGFRKKNGGIVGVNYKDDETTHNVQMAKYSPEENLKQMYKTITITEKEHQYIWGVWDDETLETIASGYLQTDASTEINNKLRGIDKRRLLPEEKKTVDALDAVIERNVLPQDVSVVRGVSNDFIEAVFGKDYDIEEVLNSNGFIITEKAYMSTALEGAGSQAFNRANTSDVVLKLKAKKGSHAFVTDNFAEGEIVFGRNTSYSITRAYLNDDMQIIIEGEIL